MARMPRDRRLDSTFALLADPYGFISRQCRRFGTGAFAARILLRDTICMTGPEAVKLFYDPGRFERAGAAPEPVRATLFGKGGVQGLDGEAHRHRKRLFMSLVTPDQVARLTALADEQWRAHARRWTELPEIVLYDELHTMLTRAACGWVGVPLPEPEVGQRTRELTALFDSAASPAHLGSRLARRRAERWIGEVVQQIRGGRLALPDDSPARAVALHRDPHGALLPPRIAAVELLNLLRPTVAVSVYIVFVAHALRRQPGCREKLEAADTGYAQRFLQEARRFYPFFPAVAARVRREFEWNGCVFPAGRRVLLDLYGTNHDARTWTAPDEFRPERFAERNENVCDFVPQGGGDPHTGHRCPGEAITLALMRTSLDALLNRIRYDMPLQDLGIDHTRLPALPRSRVVLRRVRCAF